MSVSDRDYMQASPPGDPSASLPASGAAIGSLVCGIISTVMGVPGCCCIYILAPLAVIAGGIALYLGSQARKAALLGDAGGGGLALAGMICGGVGLFFGIGWLIFLIVVLVAGVALPQPGGGGGFNIPLPK